MKKILKKIIVIIISLFILGALAQITKTEEFKAVVVEKGLTIKGINDVSYIDGNVYANVETYPLINEKKLWCIATENDEIPDFDEEWNEVVSNSCTMKIDENDTYIYVRDNNQIGNRIKIEDYRSSIVKIETKSENLKIIVGEEVEPGITLKTIGNPNKEIKYKIEDESIIRIENNKIIGLKDGKTDVTISDNYGNNSKIQVEVTSLISLPQINNSKPFISNKQYTTEEAKILDEYLFYQIDQAGYKTRAGVVAAARFLSLELKYRIPYFIENGRVTHYNHQRPYCDGEGRYYHRGLYLSVDKFAEIEKSVAGPAMWGAYIREWSEDNGIIRNGLDCSGFVCWCLINGGFDFGDIGAGLSVGLPTLADRGVSQRITMELLESRKVKAGDLIGFDGHIGIIIGVEEGYIYVADTLYHSKGLIATKYSYKELVNSKFTHIYDYTEEYEEDGNYTEMW